MPIHTVEEMMALKEQFTQKPFANFSLSNCIARKKQGERLERGADAWGGKHATTVLEAHRRQIQHSLNKISEENYGEVLGELMKPEFFDPETIKVLVSSVYQKALAEPFLAALYANLCFSLSRFEVSGNPCLEELAAVNSGANPSPFSPAGDAVGASPSAINTPGNSNAGNSRSVTPASFAAAVGASSSAATPGSLSTAATPGSARLKSLFRATIVTHAQNEFEKKTTTATNSAAGSSANSPNASPSGKGQQQQQPESVSPSFSSEVEMEEERERALKRKRANIKFVGHLFLVNVISINIMRRIVDTILHLRDTPMFIPDEADLDVLTVLLTTIGSRIDSGVDNDARSFLDEVMTRVSHLEKLGAGAGAGPNVRPRYTMRTRTKVMDLTDLRSKNWVKKAAASALAGQSNPNSTAVTPSSLMRSPATPALNRGGAAGASGMVAGGKFGSSSNSGSFGGSGTSDPRLQQFPDSPIVGNVSTPSATKEPPSFKTALLSGGNKAAQSSSKPTEVLSSGTAGSYRPPGKNNSANASGGSAAASSPSPSTIQRSSSKDAPPVSKAAASAAAAASSAAAAATAAPPSRPIGRVIQDTFKEWLCSHTLLRNWQQRFAAYALSEEELRAAIIAELLWDACMTTRSDAQLEVALFARQGLGFTQVDFYPGFLKVLRRALAEGVLTDVPKLYDRLVIAMHYAAVQQLGDASMTGGGPGGDGSTAPSAAHASARSGRTALYRQLSQLIFTTAESDPFEDDSPDSNEELTDNLLRLWQAAPQDEAVEDSVVDFMLRPRACSTKFPEMVAEMLLFSVTIASVLSAEPVKRWLNTAEAKQSPLQPLLSKNF